MTINPLTRSPGFETYDELIARLDEPIISSDSSSSDIEEDMTALFQNIIAYPMSSSMSDDILMIYWDLRGRIIASEDTATANIIRAGFWEVTYNSDVEDYVTLSEELMSDDSTWAEDTSTEITDD